MSERRRLPPVAQGPEHSGRGVPSIHQTKARRLRAMVFRYSPMVKSVGRVGRLPPVRPLPNGLPSATAGRARKRLGGSDLPSGTSLPGRSTCVATPVATTPIHSDRTRTMRSRAGAARASGDKSLAHVRPGGGPKPHSWALLSKCLRGHMESGGSDRERESADLLSDLPLPNLATSAASESRLSRGSAHRGLSDRTNPFVAQRYAARPQLPCNFPFWCRPQLRACGRVADGRRFPETSSPARTHPAVVVSICGHVACSR